MKHQYVEGGSVWYLSTLIIGTSEVAHYLSLSFDSGELRSDSLGSTLVQSLLMAQVPVACIATNHAPLVQPPSDTLSPHLTILRAHTSLIDDLQDWTEITGTTTNTV